MRQGRTMPPKAAMVTNCTDPYSQQLRPNDDVEWRLSYAIASRAWDEHQADRPWLEWGFCWPPLSVRRPRCVSCHAAWPCDPAVMADRQMTSYEELTRQHGGARGGTPATNL
jgi:hypothetical protein